MRITQLGEPVLRQTSRKVVRPRDSSVHHLIQAMIQTMYRAKGVGIAAPQVGKSLRLFIVAPRPSVRYPQATWVPPIAMINPRLLGHSKATTTNWEGCLSIPGIRARVPRYTQIQISYLTPQGQKKSLTLRNFIARIFQHEFDHINGKVFLDRVKDTRTFTTESQYRRIMGRK